MLPGFALDISFGPHFKVTGTKRPETSTLFSCRWNLFTGKEWEVLAKGLGLAPGRIEALKTRNKTNPDMVKEDMLYTWIKCSPRASERVSEWATNVVVNN